MSFGHRTEEVKGGSHIKYLKGECSGWRKSECKGPKAKSCLCVPGIPGGEKVFRREGQRSREGPDHIGFYRHFKDHN